MYVLFFFYGLTGFLLNFSKLLGVMSLFGQQQGSFLRELAH